MATEPRPTTDLERVLRLARSVTGRRHAGLALLGEPPAEDADVSLPLDHPLVRDTLRATGVHQAPYDDGAGPGSFAGVALRTSAGVTVGALWVVDEDAAALEPAGCRGLLDLGALLEGGLERWGSMGVAAQVQQQLLPEHPPAVDGFDMAAACRPALEVGGDFYDWWRTGESLRLVVSDVMGKGVSAGIVAAAVRAMLRAALTYHPPGAALSRVAGDLQSDLDQVARFATCFAAQLDLSSGTLRYADAGHGLAAVLRSDGGHHHLHGDEPPLGALPGLTWHTRRATLLPGDTLLVVSDGVLDLYASPQEALRRAREIHAAGGGPADYVAELTDAQSAGEILDDLTVLAVRRHR